MVNTLTVKKFLHKNKSKKIKLHKKKFLEKNWYAIRNKLSCQSEEGLDV
jgi:hypothetical protein